MEAILLSKHVWLFEVLNFGDSHFMKALLCVLLKMLQCFFQLSFPPIVVNAVPCLLFRSPRLRQYWEQAQYAFSLVVYKTNHWVLLKPLALLCIKPTMGAS